MVTGLVQEFEFGGGVLPARRQCIRSTAGDRGARASSLSRFSWGSGFSAGTSCRRAPGDDLGGRFWRRAVGAAHPGGQLLGCSIRWATPWSTANLPLNDIWALFTNQVFIWGYAKVPVASWTAVVMLAVATWQQQRGGDFRDVLPRAARLAIIVPWCQRSFHHVGGRRARGDRGEVPPMKIAAAEAVDTCPSHTGLVFPGG